MNIEAQLVSRIDLMEALSRLTEEQRAAVIGHYLRDASYENLAKTLGWEKWKPKKRVYEGLCAIRALWGVRLPERSGEGAPDAVADNPWWPLLMESIWQHARSQGLSIGTDS
jgi:hypothetical protein